MKENIMALKNLVDDIYTTVSSGIETMNEEAIDSFLDQIKQALYKQLSKKSRKTSNSLRMSNIGRPNRLLWYEVNSDITEELTPDNRIKFLFGDIVEALVLYLTKEAGYDVTHEQHEVEVDGIVGHTDCQINGIVVDVKSAASRSFTKFKEGTLSEDDPFGYIAQVSAYATAFNKKEAGFLVMDKQLGHLTYMPVTKLMDIPKRISEVTEIVKSPTPPEKCYDAVPDGKSGNLKLSVGCSYCKFKTECWSDANYGKGLRTFLYSTGPKFLTHVVREPDVHEVKQ